MRSTRPPSKPVREGRRAKNDGAPDGDACELLLVELKISCERLQQLLGMIHEETARAARLRRRPRHLCAGDHRQPDA